MLYSEYINKAIDATIVEADNGSFYLEPLWQTILIDNRLNIKEISDRKLSIQDLRDILSLEVEKRNVIHSKKNQVINWLFELITAQVEPAMLAEETDYLKNLTEYLKTNHEEQRLKDEEWDKFTQT